MGENIKNIIFTYFPSKKGKQSLNNLKSFLSNSNIQFEVCFHKDESGGYFVAKSFNVDNKHIITSGDSLSKLEYNVKDAVFTAFKVPNYYCRYENLVMQGKADDKYEDEKCGSSLNFLDLKYAVL